MERAIVVTGTLREKRRIDLDEPVSGMEGPVEVVLRPLVETGTEKKQGILDFISSLAPGTRSKEEIDAEVREERDSWGEG